MTSTRRERLRTRLASDGVDAFVATARSDVRYLCGFTGSAGVLLVAAAGEDRIATDGRYREQAEEQTGGLPISASRTPVDECVRRAVALGAARIGVDPATVTWSEALQAQEAASSAGAEVVAVPDAVVHLRMRKDAAEVEAIRRACTITDEALRDVLAALRPGVTERALAQVFLDGVLARGADGPSFDPIVASGPNASRPHHEPGDRELCSGDLVVIDVGARVDGYCADLSRTVGLAPVPADLRSLHELVVLAQAAGRSAVADGAAVADVDAAARDVIAAAGHGAEFVHGTGHGLGLDIHEPPLLAPGRAGTLGSSFVVTVEPGVYLPGVGGVRVEDTVLVTDDGAEPLTTTPRALLEL